MDSTKKCSKCGKELSLEQFYVQLRSDGQINYSSRCKGCIREASADWKRNNPGKVRAHKARWRRVNCMKIKEANAEWRKKHPVNKDKARTAGAKWRKNNQNKCRATSREWYRNNPVKAKEAIARCRRKRSATDPYFRMINNIRSAMSSALSGGRKAGHTEELLGCSIREARNYLETLFQSGMTWGNYGVNGWHIDHIIPLSYFDMSDPEQQKRAWHYTNLQPLWAADNRKKSNKIIETQLKLQ